MLRVNPSPFKLSPVTDQDSDGNAMEKAHAYRAQTPGEVNVYCNTTTSDVRNIEGFVGSTSDPAGAGTKVKMTSIQGLEGNWGSISFLVARNEYFEVICQDGLNDPFIHWRSFGPLKKPVDFD